MGGWDRVAALMVHAMVVDAACCLWLLGANWCAKIVDTKCVQIGHYPLPALSPFTIRIIRYDI